MFIVAGRAKATVNETISTLTISDVMMWLTGAQNMPAMGFDFSIKLYFLEDIRLPRISTCGPFCEFPVAAVQEGRRSVSTFTNWIFDSPGFGRV